MASQSQGLGIVCYADVGFYDSAAFGMRASADLGTISGSGGVSTRKFLAYTNLVIFGLTFAPTALATSTYTVNGTATTSCQSAYAVFVTNINPSGAPILQTSTVGNVSGGPFFIGGLTPPGTNVNVQGAPGLGGFFRYAINTLGGTNTTMPWGTTTYRSGLAGANAGVGGVYMNAGDTFYVIAGTDATGTSSHQLEYGLSASATLIA